MEDRRQQPDRRRSQRGGRRITDLATHDERFISLGQLADYLGLDRRTVKAEWIDSGQLPALKIGQQWRIDVLDADDFLKRKRIQRAS